MGGYRLTDRETHKRFSSLFPAGGGKKRAVKRNRVMADNILKGKGDKWRKRWGVRGAGL